MVYIRNWIRRNQHQKKDHVYLLSWQNLGNFWGRGGVEFRTSHIIKIQIRHHHQPTSLSYYNSTYNAPNLAVLPTISGLFKFYQIKDSNKCFLVAHSSQSGVEGQERFRWGFANDRRLVTSTLARNTKRDGVTARRLFTGRKQLQKLVKIRILQIFVQRSNYGYCSQIQSVVRGSMSRCSFGGGPSGVPRLF